MRGGRAAVQKDARGVRTDRKDLGTVIRSDKDTAADGSSQSSRHGRRRVLVSVGSAMLLLAAGCSSSSNSSGSSGASTATATSSAAAAADTIVIQNFAFSPATLTVAPGTTVTVVNKDAVTHTVTSTAATRAFDTGDVAAGSSTTFHAPATAGTYSYICSIHTYMHGTLTVS